MTSSIRAAIAAAALAFASAPGLASAATFYGIDSGVTSPASAHPLSDAARNNFLAALISASVGTESFESSAAGTFATLPLTFSGSGLSGTLTPLGSGAQINTSTLSIDQFALNGSRYLQITGAGGGNFLDITFSSPVRAFGFYGLSLSNYAGSAGTIPPIRISIAGGAPIDVINVSPTSIGIGSVNFFGITSDTAFSSIRLINPVGTAQDTIILDNLIVGQVSAIPEPSSALLLGLGLALVLWRVGRQALRRS